MITQNRPHSLDRLRTSLLNGHFFGDRVNLRLNLDQLADPLTLQITKEFSWENGHTFVHRRIVHGGLLPAVVESWYPSSNHTYGLLLEDDVEVSPMFYAWAKMAILRYRFDPHSSTSSPLTLLQIWGASKTTFSALWN